MKCFVITRDRVSYTQRCITAMVYADLDVIVVDHGSTWPPMLSWLDAVDELGGDQIRTVRCGDAMPRDLWRQGGVLSTRTEPGERFIVTDCDVIPDPDCPKDWPQMLSAVLDAFPRHVKVGMSLRIDNLPEHYVHAEQVRIWEAQFWTAGPIKPTMSLDPRPPVYHASIDTTLAMYRHAGPFKLDPSIRTAPPYTALHLPWYERSGEPSEELDYYREHALPAASHWLHPDRWE